MSPFPQEVFVPTTPLGSSADWLRDALATLARLGTYRDDWDSYGSPPLSQAALSKARELVLHFAVRGLPVPDIRPVSGGGVQLEWRADRTELELMILPEGRVLYLALSQKGASADGELTEAVRQEAVRLFELVFGDD
jgi:hypothetical protein